MKEFINNILGNEENKKGTELAKKKQLENVLDPYGQDRYIISQYDKGLFGVTLALDDKITEKPKFEIKETRSIAEIIRNEIKNELNERVGYKIKPDKAYFVVDPNEPEMFLSPLKQYFNISEEHKVCIRNYCKSHFDEPDNPYKCLVEVMKLYVDMDDKEYYDIIVNQEDVEYQDILDFELENHDVEILAKSYGFNIQNFVEDILVLDYNNVENHFEVFEKIRSTAKYNNHSVGYNIDIDSKLVYLFIDDVPSVSYLLPLANKYQIVKQYYEKCQKIGQKWGEYEDNSKDDDTDILVINDTVLNWEETKDYEDGLTEAIIMYGLHMDQKEREDWFKLMDKEEDVKYDDIKQRYNILTKDVHISKAEDL